MNPQNRLIIILVLVFLLFPLATINAQDGAPPTARVLCAQYVRQGPSQDADRIGLIEGGPEVLSVLAHNARTVWPEDGIWLLVEQFSSGLRGWMYDGDCLAVSGDILQTLEIAEPGYQGPPLANVVCDQYLRSEPDIESPSLAILFSDEPSMAVLGHDLIGEWLYVLRANGQQGWVQDVDCIETLGNIFSTPYVEYSYQGPIIANVVCSQYVRLEPDNDAIRIALFEPNVGTLLVVGRDVYANWFLVLAADGNIGWMYNTECLVIQGDIMEAMYPPPAAVNGHALVPSEEISNVPQVGPAITVSSVGGQIVIQTAPMISAPFTGVSPGFPVASGAPGTAPDIAPPATTTTTTDTAPAAANPNAVGGPDQTVEVDVNCHQTGTVVVRTGSSVTLALRWETTDPAQANDWIDANRAHVVLNGETLENIAGHMTGAPVELRESGTWLAGYFYPLGELASGNYTLHWDMTLGRDVSTGRATYTAGNYPLYCEFVVE